MARIVSTKTVRLAPVATTNEMISQAVEYSLRAMVWLSYCQSQPVTTQQIAEVAGIPAPYLAKLMQGLVRVELVRSRRGCGGGFVLARSTTDHHLGHCGSG